MPLLKKVESLEVVDGRLAVAARSDRTIITDPTTGETFVPGETEQTRTIFAVVSLFCAIVLAFEFGLRARTLKNNVFRKGNLTSILVVFLFCFALSFIFCTTVVDTGQSLRTHKLCYSAAMICLVFYTSNKLAIYMFLLERARIVRAPFVPRFKDAVWLTFMFLICGGFGSIAVVGYLTPIVELSRLDGRCRIGLPLKVSFPLMCFDIGVNFLLTGLFIWLLKPVLSHHGLLSLSGLFGEKLAKRLRCGMGGVGRGSTIQYSNEQKRAMNKNIKTLLWKCLIGSSLVMLPTVGNMAQFYIMKGRELGWICLTICTLDVSWGVLIINWLTMGSAQAEKNLTSLMSNQTLREEPAPLIQTVTVGMTMEGSTTELPRPAVLRDAGKLISVDSAITPVKRLESFT
ncbi:hypothetical protein P280DRAFT_523787 [Massarina eburnea CBS 473.64]|uniref:G-protein coupled receptors family 1 profile domain-containing protein n=1 Tax=Massarina eburnea CBS 473.64 TaxID=1395130 RepID=A0A6A6RHU2_9PLEO|nr:hypothetical protein P280DRAFT_523787 [Massarina eburnea CBS 473.64]